MLGYKIINLKLSNSQFDKLKDAVRKSNGTTLRIGNKNSHKAELLRELYLT